MHVDVKCGQERDCKIVYWAAAITENMPVTELCMDCFGNIKHKLTHILSLIPYINIYIYY